MAGNEFIGKDPAALHAGGQVISILRQEINRHNTFTIKRLQQLIPAGPHFRRRRCKKVTMTPPATGGNYPPVGMG
jgi:hypothetical protein